MQSRRELHGLNVQFWLFPDKPPRFIRADLYRYQFTSPYDERGAWWKRSRVGTYLHPFSLNDPGRNIYLRRVPR